MLTLLFWLDQVLRTAAGPLQCGSGTPASTTSRSSCHSFYIRMIPRTCCVDVQGSWTQRYYMDDSVWSGAAKLGPVLFIPGGEWSVTPEKGLLYGMVRELAVELGGIAMIAEHRFYGGSIPFNGSVAEAFQPRPDRIGYLSVAQAMADYARLINTVRDDHGCPDCPVISFGGSYSGKLSA